MARPRAAAAALPAVLAALAGSACSYNHVSGGLAASLAPPSSTTRMGVTASPDPGTAAGTADLPADQSACRATGSWTGISLFENPSITVTDLHARADGSSDSRSFVAGRVVDPAAGQALGLAGTAIGMLGKGAATAATGGMLLAVPQPDGSLRLFLPPSASASAGPSVAPDREARSGAWAPASGLGCVPPLAADLFRADGGSGRAEAPAQGLTPDFAPRRQALPPPRAVPGAWEPGWHAGTNPDGLPTFRRLLGPTPDGRVGYATAAGRHYVVSQAAWRAFVGGDES